MSHINGGGLALFRKFVLHLSNYSIMQIVERLFLYQPGYDGACVSMHACMHVCFYLCVHVII
jgi:hypothetical protein